MDTRSSAPVWAQAEFGSADLGDTRRTARVIKIAARAATAPRGKLSHVFAVPRELDAAYDFVESEQVAAAAIAEAHARATARRCAGLPYVRVAVDGSSLQLAD